MCSTWMDELIIYFMNTKRGPERTEWGGLIQWSRNSPWDKKTNCQMPKHETNRLITSHFNLLHPSKRNLSIKRCHCAPFFHFNEKVSLVILKFSIRWDGYVLLRIIIIVESVDRQHNVQRQRTIEYSQFNCCQLGFAHTQIDWPQRCIHKWHPQRANCIRHAFAIRELSTLGPGKPTYAYETHIPMRQYW